MMSSAWYGLENSEAITQLPHYAINEKLPEDSFYTDRNIASECVKSFHRICRKHKIDLSEYVYLEPSAGEGCFYNALPIGRRIGLDIMPKGRHIQQADFLTWYPNRKGKYVVIGNPPFGVRGAIALAFINRAFLFADLVAFILPMSFHSNGKGSNMKRVKNATLLHTEKIDANAFYLPDNKEVVNVNTIFQVWEKGKSNSVFSEYDVSEYVELYTCCSAPSRYCGLGRGRDYDCFIASTFYKDGLKIVKSFDDVLYGSGYGFIIKKNKREIMKVLKNANWNDYCSDATNHCKHIRMYHIKKLLADNGFGQRSEGSL